MSEQTSPVDARSTRVAEIKRAMDENPTLNGREIAELLGMGYKNMRGYLSDPDGSKQRRRRERYRRPCPDCGKPMDGSNGRASSPTSCADCTARKRHENRYWTRPRIIEAIQLWAEQNDGKPPKSQVWLALPASAGWPAVSNVQEEFGTWADGIRAAGLEPHAPGVYERTDAHREAIKRGKRRLHRIPLDRGDLDTVAVTLEREAHIDRVAALAKQRGCSSSEVIRVALDSYLESA
jgi:hypothetical protein